MTIIDPADFPIDPDIVDGTQLAEILNRLKLAIHSNNSNETRPPELTEGGIWTKFTAPDIYEVLIFNGVTDAPLTIAGLAKGTSFANPFDGAVNYAKGALIWDVATETLLSAKYPIPSGLPFNAGDWNANAKVEGSFLHLDGGTVVGPVLFTGAVDFANVLKLSTLTPSRALAINASGNIAVSSATNVELSYLVGATSPIQAQLDAKEENITGAATSILTANLGVSRAMASDASGKVGVSAVTSTELGFLDGVTSSIQTQLNGKATTAQAWPGVYTSSGETGTAYPLGSIVYWRNYASGSANPALRASVAVYVAADKVHYGTNNVSYADTRTALPGTWRFVGGEGATSGGLVQRAA